MRREPALIIGAVVLVVEALLQVAIVFGLNLTGDQQTTLQAAIAGLAGLAQAIWTREKVVSPATFDAHIAAATTGHPSAMVAVDPQIITTGETPEG